MAPRVNCTNAGLGLLGTEATSVTDVGRWLIVSAFPFKYGGFK